MSKRSRQATESSPPAGPAEGAAPALRIAPDSEGASPLSDHYGCDATGKAGKVRPDVRTRLTWKNSEAVNKILRREGPMCLAPGRKSWHVRRNGQKESADSSKKERASAAIGCPHSWRNQGNRNA